MDLVVHHYYLKLRQPVQTKTPNFIVGSICRETSVIEYIIRIKVKEKKMCMIILVLELVPSF